MLHAFCIGLLRSPAQHFHGAVLSHSRHHVLIQQLQLALWV